MRIRSRCPGAPSDDRGAVAIIVALFLVVFMILLAFVVDGGRAYAAKAQLQNTVDASALAAAYSLCSGNLGEVQGKAIEYAGLNDLVISSSNVFVDMSSSPRTVTVSSPGVSANTFGRVVGVNQIDLFAVAQAGILCGIRKFGIYGDDRVTFNGSNQTASYVYGGDLFEAKATNNSFVYLEVDPGMTVTLGGGSSAGTTSYAGQKLSAQSYACILPITFGGVPQGKLDACPTAATGTGGVTKVQLDAATACPSKAKDIQPALQAGTSLFCSSYNETTLTSVAGNVLASGDIVLKGPGTVTLSSKLVYSQNGSINISGVLNDDPDTVVYAPNGTVTVSASSNVFRGTIIGKVVVFDGSKQLATGEGEIIPNVGAGTSASLLQ